MNFIKILIDQLAMHHDASVCERKWRLNQGMFTTTAKLTYIHITQLRTEQRQLFCHSEIVLDFCNIHVELYKTYIFTKFNELLTENVEEKS